MNETSKGGTVDGIDAKWNARIRALTGADFAMPVERITSLWSGYGAIVRYALRGSSASTVIVKIVEPPDVHRHPRGWSSDLSHERKLSSYRIEKAFYEEYAQRCSEECRVPQCVGVSEHPEGWLFVLEDLDRAGFSLRRQRLKRSEFRACVSWLAHFHATFLHDAESQMPFEGQGLWEVGTYWHLATRPDEFEVMPDTALKHAARPLDELLNGARFSTLVHGDAKAQNYCFSPRSSGAASSVAAVDFQYVGRGCGMKDLAYFFSSCLDEEECELLAEETLDFYFRVLLRAVRQRGLVLDEQRLVEEWSFLYPVAWADFMRFLEGWAPGHHKVHGYSLAMTRRALRMI